jgi:dienelactone hydrolase
MKRRDFVRWLAAVPAAMALAPRWAWSATDADDQVWTDTVRRRGLPVRLRWPAGDAPCALVIFSHGLGGNLAAGAVWAQAWRAAGFAVLNLQHPGSDTEVLRGGRASLRSAASAQQYIDRVADAHFVLDQLERRRDTLPGLARIRLDAIGLCGHSFGARLTQAVAGERIPRADPARMDAARDPRPKAFVAFSPGFSARESVDDEVARQHFGTIERPFMCVTGTRDEAMIVGDATNAARRAVYRGLPAGHKAELVLAGADHMTFGGMTEATRSRWLARILKREAGAAELEPRHQALVCSYTTDWWRWRLLDDTQARLRLQSAAGLAEGDVWQMG